MALTTLGLDRVPPAGKAPAPPTDCPQCGAPAKQRIDGGGFGPSASVLCGRCGYEFPRPA